MKGRWLVSVLVVLVAGAAAFAVTRWTACHRCANSLGCLGNVGPLSRELRLTEVQAGAVRHLQSNLSATLAACCARHCAARAQLADALRNATNGTAEARAIVAQMCRAEADSELATLEHIQQVRSLLTPEQRALFDRRMADCMGESFAMAGGQCPTGGEMRPAD
jgi:nickel and cobalt resistance protein CnrR